VLVELAVRNLGVIEDLTLVLGPGMTALTGETGAGKTLVVEAIELLVGGRADATLVRPGVEEAWVEGRFETPDGGEVVLARAVPRTGRSRAYVDGRMAPVAALAEWGDALVDLHGQHAHQSLLSPAVQRAALDAYARVDHGPLDAARARLRATGDALHALGGDARARAREVDLLRFQVGELDDAGFEDPDEEGALEREEQLLAQAEAWRAAAAFVHDALDGDGGAGESVGAALAALKGSHKGDAKGALRGRFEAAPEADGGPFGDLGTRLAAVAAELSDIATDVRDRGERIVDDPARLAEAQARRRLLRELRRKYGEHLSDVIAYAAEARRRLAELESFERRAAELEGERESAEAEELHAAHEVAGARAAAAPALSDAIERHLRQLALPKARFVVSVGGPPPANDVEFGLGANPGEPVLPLAKVASGGELARAMLAVRLVLTAGPPTLVFDEVDAGIGGEAALSVGRALARLGSEPGRQVLVVTHLPQVAAAAQAQVAVTKAVRGGRTLSRVAVLEPDERVKELSRMLSGRPDSAAAQRHAAELLADADAKRPGARPPGARPPGAKALAAEPPGRR
jgi:DNA repair protein RecN (Recombination protein N)